MPNALEQTLTYELTESLSRCYYNDEFQANNCADWCGVEDIVISFEKLVGLAQAAVRKLTHWEAMLKEQFPIQNESEYMVNTIQHFIINEFGIDEIQQFDLVRAAVNYAQIKNPFKAQRILPPPQH